VNYVELLFTLWISVSEGGGVIRDIQALVRIKLLDIINQYAHQYAYLA